MRIATLVADVAEGFRLAVPVPLIIVPMQTVQLLDRAGRGALLAAAAANLLPGGRVVFAIADELEAVDESMTELPLPDLIERDGWVHMSQPLALRILPDGCEIERRRDSVSPAGERTTSHDVLRLAALDAETLAAEGAAVGLRAEPLRRVEPTTDHVGSTVVILAR